MLSLSWVNNDANCDANPPTLQAQGMQVEGNPDRNAHRPT
jgi:hypothetical protein